MTEHLVRYQPGDAVAVVNERTAVLLDLPATDPLVNRIVELVTDGAGIEDVLDAMVSTGLKSLASFGAFQVTSAGVRMVVRGRVSGSVGALAGLHAEHTMWHDTWQPGETAAALHLAGSADGHELVIDRGAVLAGAVYCGAPQATEPAIAPAAATRIPTLASEAEHPGSTPAPVVAAAAAAKPAPVDPAPVDSVAADPVPVAEADVDAAALAEEPIDGDAFAHLFGATQLPPKAGAEPTAAADPQSADGTPGDDGTVLDPSATMDAPLTISTEQLPTEPGPSPEPKPAALITGMPWAVELPPTEPEPHPVRQQVSPASAPVPTPAVSAPVPTPAPPAPLPTSASPQPVPGPIAPPPPATGEPVTESGSDRTVNRSALMGLPPVVMVVAARCADGHLSPAYAGSCRVCGGTIPQQQPVEIPRPVLGQLRLSTGGVVSLDRAAILGRNPRIPTGYAGEQPNLVRLSDPDKDVSGQHLEVSLDYWNVMVCDLGSTNGTEVILPGAMPVVLRPNDPVIIEPGTRVVLAGSISFVFEVMP
jgi:FHA domain